MRIIALAALILFSCVPPPIITPPEPNIPVAPAAIEFCGWGVSLTSSKNILTATTIPLIVPPSTGNFSKIESGRVTLISDSTNSGWVCSTEKVLLKDKRLSIKIIKPSWDCAFSISPTRNLQSTSGFWDEINRLRMVMYGMPKYFYSDWKRNGVREEKKLITTGAEPFYIAISFSNDSVRFERSQDGSNWQVIAQEKLNLPGYTLADSFYVELQANKTPSGGQMISEGLQIESLADETPPTAPVMLASNEAIISWNPNPEPDLAGYMLWIGKQSRQYFNSIDCRLVTEYLLTDLEYDTIYYFAVTAYDSAGNMSDFSQEVTAKTNSATKPDSNLVAVQGNSFALICIERSMLDTSGVAFDSLGVYLYGEIADSINQTPVQFEIKFAEKFGGIFRIDMDELRSTYAIASGDTLGVYAAQVNTARNKQGESMRMKKRFLF